MASRVLCHVRPFIKYQRSAFISSNRGKKYVRPDHPQPDPEVLTAVGQPPKKPRYEQEKFPKEFELERPKGKFYDKKPFKIELEAGKKYSWCTCGRSKNQPFCDGAHKQLDGTNFTKGPTQYKFRPQRFEVQETKSYWLCNCKQTGKPPFCDGTHKREDIQSTVRS